MPREKRHTGPSVSAYPPVEYLYDDASNLFEKRWDNGSKRRRFVRNALGQQIETRDESDEVVRRNTWDESGRLLRSTRPLVPSGGPVSYESRYEYSPDGREVRVYQYELDESESAEEYINVWKYGLDPDGSVRTLRVEAPDGRSNREIDVEYGKVRDTFCNLGLFGRFGEYR